MVAVIFLLIGLKICHVGSVNPTDLPPDVTDVSLSPVQESWPTLTDGISTQLVLRTEDTTSSAPPSTERIGRQPVQDYTFVIRDRTGNECLHAEFQAMFSILYRNRHGPQNITIQLPKRPYVGGICAGSSQNPILQLFWTKFSYSLIFSKLPHRSEDGTEFWGVKSMELTYDSTGRIFDDAYDAGNKSAKFLEDKMWLQIPINKSYVCSSPEVIYLYNNKKEKQVVVTLKDVKIQPYGIINEQFSDAHQCNQVTVGSQVQIINRDETLPIAVGSTFAVLTLIGVSGYAIYRTITARRVDYSTME